MHLHNGCSRTPAPSSAVLNKATRSKLDLLQTVQLADFRVRELGDGEILDREAAAVEQRDVAGAAAAFRLPGQHSPQFGHVTASDESRRDSLPDVSYSS